MGRRSKGCDACRVKKIKCDEKFPQCSQCRDSLQECPGATVGSIFIQSTLNTRGFGHQRGMKAASISRSDTKKDPVASLVTVKVTPLDPDDEQTPVAREPTLQDEKGLSASRSLFQAFDGNMLDPFKSLPRDVDRPTAWLIEIYFFYFTRKISTMGPVDLWFPLAVTDEVLLETTLFVTAAYFGLKSGSERSLLLASRHRSNLYGMINKRLESRASSVSDSMICAVALLAGSEGVNGSSGHWRVHMNGLKQMVTMRGGIKNIGAQNPATKMLASAYSTGICRIGSTPCDFFINEAFQEVIQAFDSQLTEEKPVLSSSASSWYLRIRLDDTGHQYEGTTSTLFRCLQETQEISAWLIVSHYSQWKATESRYLDGKLTVIQYRLAGLLEQTNFNPYGYMQQSLYIAVLLFIDIYLRDRRRGAAVHLDLLERFYTCIPHAQPEIGWRSWLGPIGDDLLLWVLFMGATSALGEDDKRLWFEEAILSVADRMSLRDWSFVECALKGILYSAQFLNSSLVVWNKVVAGREDKIM